jgi:uncharacterized membrane protein YtjA (UPF0391 family)
MSQEIAVELEASGHRFALRWCRGGLAMLSWAVTFLIIALVAALLGFGGIAGAAAGIAKVLFVVFLVLFLVSIVGGGFRRTV